ncbi:AzlC family ABC transporter permease [Raoultella terrigena]|uniref:AzlC family ABC transporter permease n=1 Tax=Raoultella terrigena TaxID=577 RepID=UPI001E62091D|nr:AzlC family ABC transporter permease [Raoultella terrigena]
MMSLLVFAGYAQFAALGLWGEPVPLVTLAATVFAINARHLLMGATLYPRLSAMGSSSQHSSDGD